MFGDGLIFLFSEQLKRVATWTTTNMMQLTQCRCVFQLQTWKLKCFSLVSYTSAAAPSPPDHELLYLTSRGRTAGTRWGALLQMSIFVTVVRYGAGERTGGGKVQKQNGTTDEKIKSISPSQTPLIAKHNHWDKWLALLLLKNTDQKSSGISP